MARGTWLEVIIKVKGGVGFGKSRQTVILYAFTLAQGQALALERVKQKVTSMHTAECLRGSEPSSLILNPQGP